MNKQLKFLENIFQIFFMPSRKILTGRQVIYL